MNNPSTDTITDIDGNVYKTVKIGKQIWMAENLKVKHYRNGDVIPNITDNSKWYVENKGAYCASDNDESNVETYGYLYNWHAVIDERHIEPEGWSVPTDEDWQELEMHLGVSQSEVEYGGGHGTDEGGKLKEAGTTHWRIPNVGATNESGFSALPGGSRGHDYGCFRHIGEYTNFWSSTEGDNLHAWSLCLNYDDSNIGRVFRRKEDGLAIRLIRD